MVTKNYNYLKFNSGQPLNKCILICPVQGVLFKCTFSLGEEAPRNSPSFYRRMKGSTHIPKAQGDNNYEGSTPHPQKLTLTTWRVRLKILIFFGWQKFIFKLRPIGFESQMTENEDPNPVLNPCESIHTTVIRSRRIQKSRRKPAMNILNEKRQHSPQ